MLASYLEQFESAEFRLTLRAWVDNAEILIVLVVLAGVASVVAVKVLHQTRVVDISARGFGGWHAHTSMGLLHDYRKDEAMINARRLCNGLNAIVDVTNFFTGILSDAELIAALEHGVFVVVEPERRGRRKSCGTR